MKASQGIKDLIDLKMQKKLIEAQLADVNHRTRKLDAIVDRKKKDRNSTLYEEAPAPEMNTVILGRTTLNDLRPIQRSCKAIPKPPPRDINDIDPSPIPLGGDLERIRYQHIRRTVGKVEIGRRTKIKNEKLNKKAAKEGMKHAPINIPESMFPNRYLRGELPCTIEHGVKGLYLSWVCPLENLDYDYYLPIFFDGLHHYFILCLNIFVFIRAAVRD
jgi:hypothetical protein